MTNDHMELKIFHMRRFQICFRCARLARWKLYKNKCANRYIINLHVSVKNRGMSAFRFSIFISKLDHNIFQADLKRMICRKKSVNTKKKKFQQSYIIVNYSFKCQYQQQISSHILSTCSLKQFTSTCHLLARITNHTSSKIAS